MYTCSIYRSKFIDMKSVEGVMSMQVCAFHRFKPEAVKRREG